MSYLYSKPACQDWHRQLYQSRRDSVLRTPAPPPGIRTFRLLHRLVLIPVVFRQVYISLKASFRLMYAYLKDLYSKYYTVCTRIAMFSLHRLAVLQLSHLLLNLLPDCLDIGLQLGYKRIRPARMIRTLEPVIVKPLDKLEQWTLCQPNESQQTIFYFILLWPEAND